MKEGEVGRGRKRKMEGGVGAVVEAVTGGALINNCQLNTPSWLETPVSILISVDVVCCALSTRPGLCAGQNQLLSV